MNQCKSPGDAAAGSDMLRKHFPYVRREPNGDFVIPADRLDQFVRKYMALADNKDHLAYLNMYRNDPKRPDSGETGE